MAADKNQTLHQPHDKLLFQSLRNPRIAQDALESYLPKELLSQADLSNIRLYKTKLISPQYKAFEADIIYEIPLVDSACLCIFHCEHQTKIEKTLPLRLWQYMLLVLSEYSEQHPKNPLPLPYPMVIYTGEQKYNKSTNLFDLFEQQKESALQYMTQPIKLLDVCQMDDDEILKKRLFSLSELAFKYKNTYHFARFLETVFPLIEKVASQTGEQYINNLLTYITNAFTHADHQQYEKVVQEYLSKKRKEKSMTIVEQWQLIGLKKGLQEGREKGHLEGLREGHREGHQKGLEAGKRLTAINLLKINIDEKLIAKATGFSLEEVQALKEKEVTNCE